MVLFGEVLVDLFRTLEAQVGAAEHEQRREQERRELTQQKQRRKDEEQLVAQRTLGDCPDDRQLAPGIHAVHVARGHRGIVHDDARGLGARATGRGSDVVNAGRGQLHERGNVIQ